MAIQDEKTGECFFAHISLKKIDRSRFTEEGGNRRQVLVRELGALIEGLD